tara:strand:+ start:282 stop:524 length:243 start_codon:yes stop_codon:yes gene_type:complete
MASKSAEYYRSHPEARRRKMLYDRKYHSTPARKAYRKKLARVRRAKGVMGKGGKDVSHTKSGGFRMESVSKNRARNRGKA